MAGVWGLDFVHQNQVIDKLLFGSDFPYTSATECIEALYSINQIAQGTNLPVVPRECFGGLWNGMCWPCWGLGDFQVHVFQVIF